MTEATDLEQASREELLAVIAAQQQTITVLQARVSVLEARLGAAGSAGMPGTKPSGSTRAKASGRPRKRRPHGFARRRMAPTRRVTHAAAQCPDCGATLRGGWVKRRREVIDLPAAPVEVVEHTIVARTCPVCQRTVLPAVDLGAVVVGRQRLSARVVSLVATLREVGRLPVRTIQWYLATRHGLHLSLGAIVRASAQVAARASPIVTELRDTIRASPVVAADETGWRENGRNGYVWTFATPTTRYFVRGSRAGAMVDTVLGEDFGGIVTCDFYAAYHHLLGPKQRCWAHLLREVHDLSTAYPTDAALAGWKTALHDLYRQAVQWSASAPADPHLRVQAQRRFEAQLQRCCAPFADDPLAPQAKLCRRIARHLSELFVFVAHPDAPADNNLAERSLRPLVTARKISGGTRSPAGSDTKMATASLFGTWVVRGLNPLTACHQLLLTPQL